MTSDMDRREIFLEEMGIAPVWHKRMQPAGFSGDENSAAGTASVPLYASDAASDVTSDVTSKSDVANMDWAQLEAAAAHCTQCGLCQSRTQTVFGTGDRNADWLFIGEGPGRNEDLQGEPFVGPAGKLLDNMLLAIGLQRDVNVYIANIVKCRPIGADGRDRPPSAEESAACMPFLECQIALIQPSIIVALGKTAALSLLGMDQHTSVAQLRGTVHQFANVPVIVTYHPAYLLRKLEEKGQAWRDLCLASTTYANGKQPAA